MIGTPDPRAGTGGPLHRFLRRPGAPEALRRATWLTVAGCAGFYTLAYAFDRRDMALFAMFGALPLILFCTVPGPPPRRTGTVLLTLPAGWALVTAGTLLAVQDWAAALGMLVVGFAVSLLANGGPRTAGPAPALQLYYVLPCFPPYAPDALPARLAGLTVGILLTALVDRLLWREPPPVPYRSLLADAAGATAGYCDAVGRLLAGDGTAADVRGAREAAGRALTATLLSEVPAAERPTSATPRDRALVHARAAVRHVRDTLDAVVDDRDGPVPGAPGLLRHCADSLRRTASSLRADVRDPGGDDALHAALAAFDEERARGLARATPGRLRRDAVVRRVAEGTLVVGEAGHLAAGGRLSAAWDYPGSPFAYAGVGTAAWWWHRLVVRMAPTSVLFRNALRLSLALAAARLLVGALELPHGFWVLLTVLSLMRTSAADTRAALVPGVVGTVVGGVLATGMLLAAGGTTAFYAVFTPFFLLVGLTVGPVLGPAWTQGVVTVALVLIFGQVAPPDWDLPAVRLLAVLVGGGIGAVASLLAWPRGAAGQLRRDIARFLTRAAAACPAVTARLVRPHDGGVEELAAARRALFLAQGTYLQYHMEAASRDGRGPPWEAFMLPGYAAVGGGSMMLARRRGDAPAALPAAAGAELSSLASLAAAACLAAAASLRSGRSPRPDPAGAPPAEASGALRWAAAGPASSARVADVLLVADAEAWLAGVVRDAGAARG
ncbi:FUSC family protein [Streptomyces huiliensis]|uniref:FUSC family protein n=1 Tax=Streptomyces huiliensis TaxID=2876027 RepID=UPI001CBC2DD5|nr:FUSC family protein [Streptomyces huiliensis]MBZ4323234.1 FUSC family protein [Streptomyces huiliensis]